MIEIVLVIHLLLAFGLIGVVLLQRSEGGGLGIGGSGGGMGNFMTGRGTKNLLTRTTAILAACFMVTSLTLTWLESRSVDGGSLIQNLPTSAPASTEPAEPKEPSVPIE